MILFYVQHLLGTGHLRRVASVAAHTASSGYPTSVVCGGVPVPGVTFGSAEVLQLPALKSVDTRFAELVDADGQPVDELWKQRRAAQLLEFVTSRRPRVVVVETFPFGRRKLRFELLPLLAKIRRLVPRPELVCSIRDILQSGRAPDRIDETLDLLNNNFSAVLVHGDERFIGLDESFPALDRLTVPIVYTGFVHDIGGGCAGSDDVPPGEILVSAGGGAAAGRLFEVAVQARRISCTRTRPWRLLVGGGHDWTGMRRLRQDAGEGCRVEPNREDFPALLRRCAVSVSQAGYNTVLDVLRAGARSVLVPFEGHGETEQLARAQRLESLGRARVVPETQLSPVALAAAIDNAAAAPSPGPAQFRFDGAQTSARWLVAKAGGA